jgi:phage shock protein A
MDGRGRGAAAAAWSDAFSDAAPWFHIRMLEQKLAEAKSKKDTLKARAKSASASKQITEMIQGLNTSNALTAFDKMEEKVMALEAESESTLQVGFFRLRDAPS